MRTDKSSTHESKLSTPTYTNLAEKTDPRSTHYILGADQALAGRYQGPAAGNCVFGKPAR